MGKESERTSNDQFSKVPLKEKIAYFVGEAGSQSLFYYLILTLSSYFYTDVMHISAATIGIVIIVSRLFDMFSDLIVGHVIDRTHTKWGKARPLIIAATLPYAISLLLLYCVPASWSSAGQVAFVVITYNLAVTVCYTLENIPWGTLCTLMSRDKTERTKLSTLRMVGSPLGGTLGVATVLPFIELLGGTQRAWQTGMGVFAVIGIIVNVITVLTIKERVVNEEPPEKSKLDIPSVVRNKYWWMDIAIIGIYNAFITCSATTLPYFAKYILKDTMLTTNLNNAQTISLALTALACFWLCRKINNTKLVRIGMCIALPAQLLGIVFYDNMTILMIATCLRSIGWGLLAAIIHSMVSDAVEYGHWRTGHRAEGTTYSAQGMGNKIGVLLGGGLTSIFLGLSGYDGSLAVQCDAANQMICAIYLWLPVVFAAVIFVIMAFYKIDKEYDGIIKELLAGKYHPKAAFAPTDQQ